MLYRFSSTVTTGAWGSIMEGMGYMPTDNGPVVDASPSSARRGGLPRAAPPLRVAFLSALFPFFILFWIYQTLTAVPEPPDEYRPLRPLGITLLAVVPIAGFFSIYYVLSEVHAFRKKHGLESLHPLGLLAGYLVAAVAFWYSNFLGMVLLFIVMYHFQDQLNGALFAADGSAALRPWSALEVLVFIAGVIMLLYRLFS